MRTCLDCQFLTKRAFMGPDPQRELVFHNLQWDDGEIEARELSGELSDKAECYRGVWSQSSDPSLDVKASIESNRKNCKFFMRREKSMLTTTADELWQIKKQNRRHWSTIIAIVLSAILGGVIGGWVDWPVIHW